MTRQDWIRRAQQKKRNIELFRQYEEEQFTIRDYVQSLADTCRWRHVSKVVGYFRISHHKDAKRKLLIQEEGLRWELEDLGIEMVKCFSEQCPGWLLDLKSRPELHKAMKRAGALCLPLIAPCSSRYVRPPDIHAVKNLNAPPLREQWEQIGVMAEQYGVSFMVTKINVEATSLQEREYLIKTTKTVTGAENSNYRLGVEKAPGWTIGMRKKLLPRALRMRRHGLSLGEIALVLGLSKATVQTWLNRPKLVA